MRAEKYILYYITLYVMQPFIKRTVNRDNPKRDRENGRQQKSRQSAGKENARERSEGGTLGCRIEKRAAQNARMRIKGRACRSNRSRY